MTLQRIHAPTISGTVWAQLILLGVLWGGSFFLGRIAVQEVHPLLLVLLRVGIAALALHLYLALAGLSFRPAWTRLGAFLMLGLVNNAVPFSLIFIGQTELGAGAAAVLNATTPFWTLIIANYLTADERLSRAKLMGVLLGIAGTGMMIGPGLTVGLGGPLWAKAALIGVSLSYASAFICAKRFRDLPPTLIATGQLTAATVIMTPLALLLGSPGTLRNLDLGLWSAILALALLSTAAAYILYFRILAAAGATNASLVTLIVPAGAILLGFIFLGERLEWFEVVGMALIALGLLVIDGRLWRRIQP